MEYWIPLTIFAAFMQTWRNAFQNKLSKDVSSLGVTLARFIYAVPLAAIYVSVLFYSAGLPFPKISGYFCFAVLAASIAQIFATALMIKLFQLRNFAVGVGLAKSEAVIAAILGALFFSAPLSLLAWSGVCIGGLAVWFMSKPNRHASLSLTTVGLGLGSGLCFALTTLWVREASLILQLPFPHGAAFVLFWVLLIQTIVLLVWLGIREVETLRALWLRPKITLFVSTTSFLGSIGWFSAMSLQSVALVKTLGQVEILFTLLLSAKLFKEKLTRYDLIGLFLVVLGAVIVILA